jgi:drug/metabolite transporter (DMT)-like permease
MHYWLYLIALISLSQASIIIRWSQTDPLLLGIWRLFLAAMVLRSFALISLNRKRLPQNSAQVSAQLSSRQWRNIILTGVFFFVHLYSYAWAAHHTTIAHLMLIYSINPVFTAIGNLVFFKEKITWRLIAAFVLAFLGLYFLVVSKTEQGNQSWDGDWAAVLAAITFSAYALLSKHSRKSIPNSIFTSTFYGIASMCFLLATLGVGLNPFPQEPNSWMAIVLLALFPTILGHGIFTYCMNFIDIQILSLGKLIEPIMSATSAWLLFGEPITTYHVLSFLLIATGISLVLIKINPKKIPEVAE